MNPKPHHLNRRRNHALIRWSDIRIGITFILTAAAIWLAAYSITTAIIQ